MKTTDLMILAIAGLAAWVILKKGLPALAQMVGAQEIATSALPGQPGYGWRYFDDGTVIDPLGRYYSNGQLVWSPS